MSELLRLCRQIARRCTEDRGGPSTDLVNMSKLCTLFVEESWASKSGCDLCSQRLAVVSSQPAAALPSGATVGC